MHRLILISDTFKATITTAVTFFMTAKPMEWSDSLDVIGKVAWIVASALAIAWWILRFYNQYFRRKK